MITKIHYYLDHLSMIALALFDLFRPETKQLSYTPTLTHAHVLECHLHLCSYATEIN